MCPRSYSSRPYRADREEHYQQCELLRRPRTHSGQRFRLAHSIGAAATAEVCCLCHNTVYNKRVRHIMIPINQTVIRFIIYIEGTNKLLGTGVAVTKQD